MDGILVGVITLLIAQLVMGTNLIRGGGGEGSVHLHVAANRRGQSLHCWDARGGGKSGSKVELWDLRERGFV